MLVASRDLGDPRFPETVILLVQYDAQGVVGLILNRRTDIPLSRVLEGLKAAKDRSDPVHFGGPVESPMVFTSLQSPAKIEGAEHIFSGVYLISTKTLFEKVTSAQPDPGIFMFISVTPDGRKINCGRRWSWARGSFFPRKPARFSTPIRIPCGWK